MLYEEIKWVRNGAHKLCPLLRKHVMTWYRSSRYTPCFFNQVAKIVKSKWKKIPVIVQISPQGFSAQSVNSIASTSGCKIRKNLALINCFSTEVSEHNLQALVENNDVIKVWYDNDVHTVLDVATPSISAGLLWEQGFTGKGVTIAILDTGIYNHPDLAGRIVAFRDFINNKQNPYDDNGHGTHVAGCAASNGKTSGKRYSAPAPDAKLAGVKVLNKRGSGSFSTVIEGISWCIEKKDQYNIRIINLSLGSESYQSYQNDPVCMAVERGWAAGIVVCAAAGNSGPNPRTINSPANHPIIISVGAADDRNTADLKDDIVAYFSSRGPTIDGLSKPDVLAPGTNIISLRSPKSYIDKQDKSTRVDNYHTSLSGTSMATPICAGFIALLLEMDKTLTPDEIKTSLKNNAVLLANFIQNDQGAGFINGKKL